MLKELYNEHASAGSIEDFVAHFDHHTPFFRDHYYNILERLAGRQGVLHSDAYGGFSLITSHDMLLKVSNDVAAFSNVAGYRVLPISTVPPQIPDDLDGPEHEYFRRVLNPHFTPKAIAGYQEGIEADIARIMHAAQSAGRIDVATELGQPVTGMVTMRLLGFPPEDWAMYSLPIHNAAFSIGSLETRIAEGVEYGNLVRRNTAAVAADPNATGLIGHLARARLNGRTLTGDEIERIVMNLIIGGLDTTQAVLSCAAVYLGRHPDRRRELADHPERIPNAALEFLRVFASALITGRYTTRDTEIDGYAFPEGKTAMLFWTAGNFDPAFVESPFSMDFARERQRNVTFAMGPHRCLGLQLAKMELASFITALVALPHYELIEEGVHVADDIGSTVAYLNVPVCLRAPS